MDDLPDNHILNLFKTIRKNKWLISCLFLIGALVGLLFNKLTDKVCYETSATLIINKHTSNLMTNDIYTQEDLAMYEKVLNTYEELAKSDMIITTVASQFPSYDDEQIRQMVTSSTISNTFFLKISVQGEHPQDITQIANTYTQTVINNCYHVLPIGNLTIVAAPQLPTKPLPSNLIPHIVIGAFLGLLIALCLIYYKSLKHMNTLTLINQLTTSLDIGIKINSTESLRLFMQEIQLPNTIRCIGLTTLTSKTKSFKSLCALATIFNTSAKILIIDANPFNTTLSKKLKLTKKAGLHDVLNFLLTHKLDPLSPSECLSSYIYQRDHFYIMPLGKNYTLNDLSQIEQFEKLLVIAKHDFDYIFINYPPLEHLSYLQPLTPFIDYLLILMQADTIESSKLTPLKETLCILSCPNKSCLLNISTNL